MTKLKNTSETVDSVLLSVGGKKYTPLQVHRIGCLECCCGSKSEVRLCPSTDCAPYEFRFGTNPYHMNSKKKPELISNDDIPPAGDKRRSPLNAHREHCIDCSGGSKAEVKNCTDTNCIRYEFRFGTDPNLKGSKKKLELVS